MPIRKYTIDPPFAHQAGDEYRRVGTQIEQLRNDIVIETRPAVSSLLTGPEHLGSFALSAIYEDAPMAISLTVVDVIHNETHKLVKYSNGTEDEMPVAALNANADEAEGLEALKKDIAAYWRARSSDFGSATPIVGKTFQKDLSLELNHFAVGEV